MDKVNSELPNLHSVFGMANLFMDNLRLPHDDTVSGCDPLLVMCPHPYDFDGPYLFQDLVYETMLDIDATGVGT